MGVGTFISFYLVIVFVGRLLGVGFVRFWEILGDRIDFIRFFGFFIFLFLLVIRK